MSKSKEEVLEVLEQWATEDPELFWERSGEILTIHQLIEEVQMDTELGKLVSGSLMDQSPTVH